MRDGCQKKGLPFLVSSSSVEAGEAGLGGEARKEYPLERLEDHCDPVSSRIGTLLRSSPPPPPPEGALAKFWGRSS